MNNLNKSAIVWKSANACPWWTLERFCRRSGPLTNLPLAGDFTQDPWQLIVWKEALFIVWHPEFPWKFLSQALRENCRGSLGCSTVNCASLQTINCQGSHVKSSASRRFYQKNCGPGVSILGGPLSKAESSWNTKIIRHGWHISNKWPFLMVNTTLSGRVLYIIKFHHPPELKTV